MSRNDHESSVEDIPNLGHITIMVWNVRGAGNRDFLNILNEHIRMQKPHIIALLETHISGDKADEVCGKIGF